MYVHPLFTIPNATSLLAIAPSTFAMSNGPYRLELPAHLPILPCPFMLTFPAVSAIGWGTANIVGDWSWRSITFIQCVPSLIQIAGVWWFPESPRYLVSKDRLDEALDVLAKHHAGGDSQNAVVQFQYREIKELVHDRKAQSTSYKDFFATKGNRWRLAIIVSLGVFSQYSGNAVFSNYINIVYKNAGITSQNKKLAVCTTPLISIYFHALEHH